MKTLKTKYIVIGLLIGLLTALATATFGIAHAAVNSGATNTGSLKSGYTWADSWVGGEASFKFTSNKRFLGMNTVQSRVDIGTNNLNGQEMLASITTYDGSSVANFDSDKQTISASNRAVSETRTITRKKVVQEGSIGYNLLNNPPDPDPIYSYLARMTGTAN